MLLCKHCSLFSTILLLCDTTSCIRKAILLALVVVGILTTKIV